MGYVVFDRATGILKQWVRNSSPSIDPAIEVRIKTSTSPDARTKRWDGANGLRDATAQEIADYDEAELDIKAITDIDNVKALKALVLWLAPLVGKTPQEARAEIIAIYKGL